MRDAPDHAKAGSYKINDLYLFDELVAAIALDEQLCTLLRPLLGGDPTACYSLNFERGSQQPFHLDTLYMPGPTPILCLRLGSVSKTSIQRPARFSITPVAI